MNTNLSLAGLVYMYALMLAPLAIIFFLKLGLVRQTLFGLLRMTLQLFLVGLYLKFIFELNHPLVTTLWLAIMLVVANFSVLQRAGLKRKPFFWRTLLGIMMGTLFSGGWFLFVALRPEPLFDARYMVPVIGMILGNSLRSNVLSLERFYSSIRENEQEFTTYLMLGASLREAVLPYLRASLRAAVNPALATMATMGIVSLPGMMTGQILGGAMPQEAIKYQIAIMICIFSAMMISSSANIFLSLPVAFDKFHRLKKKIFR
jgi:putative ABC transport system permease protein